MSGLLSVLLLAGAEGDALSRSLYVPLELKVCEHLRGAVLYREDEPLRELPGRQVFQFTFFPSLNRIEPEFERVRVVGEGFRTEIVITPASVYVGNKKIGLDVEGHLHRLRHDADSRHEPVKLTLRCGEACARTPAPTASR
jgi:hypothetical protein